MSISVMQEQTLIPHLFRTEYRKIVAVLCKHFGLAQIETAEDIASETFLTAAQTWPMNGIPPNPVAWLYQVAKNKTINHLQRHKVFDNKIAPQLKNAAEKITSEAIDLSEENIYDSQLQMMFAICHPTIPAEAQIGLALRILCGFGIDEIASAFLENKDTINKRLYRAKEKLRSENIKLILPPNDEINQRLDAVLITLYLLFNEGYYSENSDSVIREDLCQEAMRLTYMLTENETTNLPPVKALLALMCFHASRFEARKNDNGEIVLYHNQDESLWNQDLIARGAYFLQDASYGSSLSKYHLEASIAYWHTQKTDSKEKWENILQLYNRLIQLEYSPIAALNRTYALAKTYDKQTAITEAEKLQLKDNHLYHSLLAELYSGIDNNKALQHLNQAFSMAKSLADKTLLSKKILLYTTNNI